jgi:hypothetical protein
MYTLSILARIGGLRVCEGLIPVLPLLNHCYEIANRGQSTDKRRTLKLVVVELLNEVLNAFINTLINGDLTRLDEFISVMHELIEASVVDGHATYLETAPLLVDFDVGCNLSKSLKRVKGVVGAKEEGRVEFLIQAVDAQVDATGNSWRIKSSTAAWVEDTATVPFAVGGGGDKSAEIAQVADLFPHLGEGFIEALLNEFHTPELVIDRVLNENYPSHIERLDRGMGRKETGTDLQVALAPQHSLEDIAQLDNVSTRANVHDGDEFDIFRHGSIDSAKVIHGKKEMYVYYFDSRKLEDDFTSVADRLQQIETIYEDEPDDTYDSAGIVFTGQMSTSGLDVSEETNDPTMLYESELVELSQSSPKFFEKGERKSSLRVEFRKKSGLSDEQIEGWLTMFLRNVRLEFGLTR